MRKGLCLVVALVGGAAAVAQAPAPTEKLKEGYWKPEKVEFQGKQQLAGQQAKDLMTLIVQGAEYRMYYTTDSAKGLAVRLFTGEFKADPATKTFEMEVKDGQKKGHKVHGIYEVNKDTLKLCYAPVNEPRPTKFESPADGEVFNEVWTYQKPLPK
jgi:uncharacterized protein (TIGR03067 family)